MKFSVATVIAFATAVFAQPKLTNSNFDIVEGRPFVIKWSGQQGPVTITLKNGPSGSLKTVKVIQADVDGDSFTWTPKDLPSDTYAFEINDSSKEPNYSKQFIYEGTGPALSSSSSASSSATKSITSAASSTSSGSITSSASESTHNSTSITTTSKASTTTRAPPSNTVVNNNPSEGQRFSSPLALLLVTVAGVIFFN